MSKYISVCSKCCSRPYPVFWKCTVPTLRALFFHSSLSKIICAIWVISFQNKIECLIMKILIQSTFAQKWSVLIGWYLFCQRLSRHNEITGIRGRLDSLHCYHTQLGCPKKSKAVVKLFVTFRNHIFGSTVLESCYVQNIFQPILKRKWYIFACQDMAWRTVPRYGNINDSRR